MKLEDNKNYVRYRRAARQFVKYCLVGASGFILNLLVFWFMITSAGVHYWVAGSVSFAVAVTNNFFLNKYWTFGNARGQIVSQARRFLIISLLSWALNMFMLRLLIEDANLSPYVAQTLSVSMVTALNFLGNKLWSFRQPAA